MASKLVVNTDYLGMLAYQLDDTSDEIVDAASATEDVQPDVWLSHGVLSGESNEAIGEALEARDGAATAVTAAFTALHDKLLKASSDYDDTDKQAAEALQQPTVGDS